MLTFCCDHENIDKKFLLVCTQLQVSHALYWFSFFQDGIGDKIGKKIDEFIKSGTLQKLEKARNSHFLNFVLVMIATNYQFIKFFGILWMIIIWSLHFILCLAQFSSVHCNFKIPLHTSHTKIEK